MEGVRILGKENRVCKSLPNVKKFSLFRDHNYTLRRLERRVPRWKTCLHQKSYGTPLRILCKEITWLDLYFTAHSNNSVKGELEGGPDQGQLGTDCNNSWKKLTAWSKAMATKREGGRNRELQGSESKTLDDWLYFGDQRRELMTISRFPAQVATVGWWCHPTSGEQIAHISLGCTLG